MGLHPSAASLEAVAGGVDVDWDQVQRRHGRAVVPDCTERFGTRRRRE
jgi:hypothetical protein